MFIIENYLKFTTCRLPSWWRNATSSFWKRKKVTWEDIIQIRNFWQFRPFKFSNKAWRENTRLLNHLVQKNLLIQTLAKKCRHLSETDIENHDESNQKSVNGQLGPSGIRCKERNPLFGKQINFYEWKMSIETMIDDMHPVVLENKKLSSKEKIENICKF